MKVRVLHVITTMNKGGAETYLMRILRRYDRDKFEMKSAIFIPKTQGPMRTSWTRRESVSFTSPEAIILWGMPSA